MRFESSCRQSLITVIAIFTLAIVAAGQVAATTGVERSANVKSTGPAVISNDVSETELENTLAAHPDRLDILLQLARIHVGDGALDRADQELQRYLTAKPDTPAALGLAGEVRFREHDLPGAQSYFLRVLRLDPEDGMAHKLLALSYIAQNEWQPASIHLNRAVELLPSDEEAHYWYGRYLLWLGDLPHAISEFRTAVRIRPDYIKAWDNLGLCFDQQQQFEIAKSYYWHAIQLDRSKGTHYVWPYINLAAMLNHTRNYRETIALLQPIAEWKPPSAAIFYHLGRAYLSVGKREAAQTSLLKCTELDPSLALPHYQLARIYQLNGDAEGARRERELFERLATPSHGNAPLY